MGPTRIAVVFVLLATSALAVPKARQQRASPHDEVRASIDGADVSITYGRPYVRGRTIFGGLVPFDRVWCPGADEATTLTTSKPLRIGDLLLDAPKYTLWILPTADAWQLVVNKQTGQWHTQYRQQYDLGRVTLDKHALKSEVEQLTFAFRKNHAGGGAIVLTWEQTEAAAPFTVVP